MQTWPKQAAIVGAGYMGTGFAQVLARAGIPCRLADATPQRAQDARAATAALAERFVAQGLLTAADARAIEAGVSAAASIAEAVADADLVLEAVSEDPDVKARVFAEVERAAPADAIVATNTSAIPIRDLAAGFARPERFLGLHWFNPPQWVPGVEIIPGPRTDEQVVRRCHDLVTRLGKRPVTVGDRAGFVANRIQFAMFKEAVSVVADGVATAEQVDEIVRTSFGFRLPFYGPFTIADMAGLDVYAGAYAALERDLGPRFAAPEALRELVDAGRLGAKSGGGFTRLDGDDARRRADERDAAYVAFQRLLAELGGERDAA